jgi:aspartate aminotransferase-like enzyme
MNKEYLLTPGPCPVPPRVSLAIARPVIHHRSDEYHAVHTTVTEGLRTVFKTSGVAFIFACSGTGVMEGAVVNTLSPGDEAIVIRCGKFSGRWAELCGAFGVKVVPVDVEWGKAVQPGAVARAIEEHPSAAVVFSTLCETSTAVRTDLEALASVTRESRAILVVDATSGVGVSDIRMDAWGVDVAVAGGQKGLMLPTGLGIAVVASARAWECVERSSMPKYYFDWGRARDAAAHNETAWSSPAPLVVGLREALDLILAEGVDNVIARHARMGRACRAGVTALGLKLLAPESPADGVTGLWAPEGISAARLKEVLLKDYGVNVAGGQERLKGMIIRIAHMGYAGPFDVITAIAALEMALNDLGHPVELGRGVAAAEQVFREA